MSDDHVIEVNISREQALAMGKAFEAFKKVAQSVGVAPIGWALFTVEHTARSSCICRTCFLNMTKVALAYAESVDNCGNEGAKHHVRH